MVSEFTVHRSKSIRGFPQEFLKAKEIPWILLSNEARSRFWFLFSSLLFSSFFFLFSSFFFYSNIEKSRWRATWLDSVLFERRRRCPGPSRISNQHSSDFRAPWKRWFHHGKHQERFGGRDQRCIEYKESKREREVGLTSFIKRLHEFTLVVSRCDPLVIRPGLKIFHGFHDCRLSLLCVHRATKRASFVTHGLTFVNSLEDAAERHGEFLCKILTPRYPLRSS